MRSFGLSDAKVAAFVRHSGTTRRTNVSALRVSGWSDEPALTLKSTEGDHPHGRELSIGWLTGTVMTGLTSVLLMGAALYVSFEGQDTFSTAYEALQLLNAQPDASPADRGLKSDRVRPIAQTKSDYELVDASIRELTGDRSILRKQSFVRIRATLATAATALAADVPDCDPVALLETEAAAQTPQLSVAANPELYGASIDGEVSIKTLPLPSTLVPAPSITDAQAVRFVTATIENLYAEGGSSPSAYAPSPGEVRDLARAHADRCPLSIRLRVA